MALFAHCLLNSHLSENIILVVVKTVIRKMVKPTFTTPTINNMCDFVLVVWQNYSEMFTGELVEQVLGSYVGDRLTKGVHSLSAIYLSLWRAYISGVHTAEPLLTQLPLQVKHDRLLQNNPNLEEKFYR